MNMYELLCTVSLIELVMLIIQHNNKISTVRIMFYIGGFLSCYGYSIASESSEVGMLLIGNQISYLGGLTCLVSLVLIIAEICNLKLSPYTKYTLICFGALIMYFVMTARINGLYYRDISVSQYNGIFYFTKTRGPAYITMIIMMIFCNTLPIYIIIRSLRQKKKVSYRTAVMLVVILVVSTIIYAIPRIIKYPLDLTPFSYVIDMTLLLVIFKRADMYDMTGNLFEIYDKRDEYGYMCLDAKKRFMGATDELYRVVPELVNQRIDEVFDKQIFNTPMPVQIVDWVESWIDSPNSVDKERKFYQGDKRWDASIHAIDGHGKKGYFIEFHDDTKDLRIIENIEKERARAEKAQKDAENANASKSAFLAVVSHEIRTPLNAIVGMTDLILRDGANLTEKQSRYLENIKTSGSALVMIVNDILDQSKIEAGKMEIVCSAYEFAPLIDDVKMLIENRIGDKPVELIVDIDKNIPKYLVGDGLRIRQILINLMNNAVKYTAKGYIKLYAKAVGVKDDKIAVRFGVKDSGQGIMAKDLLKLGEAFTQVDLQKNHTKEGTGLGLSISRDFISMMGGQLSVTSMYGEGSEFYFTILQSITDEPNIEQMAAVNEEQRDFYAAHAKVLVVDDVEFNLLVAGEQLKQLCGVVDSARSGEKAIEMIVNNDYDMVFMDYMMPYMDGIETTENIRKLADMENFSPSTERAEYYKKLTIVALTSDISDETKARFTESGINDFMEKPVDFAHFKKMVKKWIPANKLEYK